MMLNDLYVSELLSAEYRRHCMEEAKYQRLLNEILAAPRVSAWKAIVLAFAQSLIVTGRRLQTIGNGM